MYQWNSQFGVKMGFIGLLEWRAGRDCVGMGDVATPKIFPLFV